MPSPRRILRQLKRLWEQVPVTKCKGLCQRACGPIPHSEPEAIVIKYKTGQEIGCDPDTLRCSMLTAEGRCSIYEVRPLLCRMYGGAVGLSCPFGCEVEGRILTREEAGEIFEEAAGIPVR